MPQGQYIVHIDMDAFFAAIEQRDAPHLQGKPVVIGADPKEGRGRGVVSTCSYEARKYGIHSSLPISIAYRKCPHALFLPVDMEKYSRVSDQIYEIFYEFTPEVEGISIDEAFLDIRESYHLFGSPIKTCILLKSRIKEETNLTASIGLAPIKMAAKIASDLEKPDGMVEVTEERLLDFLWPLDISKIWGLGRKSKDALDGVGIKTIGDLARRDPKDIVKLFGKNGLHFWELANGIDERSVETENETKSISNEHTFGEDTLDQKKIESTLMLLSEKVSNRMRVEGFKGRTVTLKIRLEGFHTYTRARTLAQPTNLTRHIYKEVKKLYDDFATKKKVRLLGVKASNLSGIGIEETLFESANDKDEKEEELEE